MDRIDLDINGLSRSFQKTHVLITCSGEDSTFSVYQHALTSHFSRTPVVWKRNNKVFPHRLTFPLKFVQYEEKLCFGPHITPLEICNIAYLHIYQINVTNTDDYRSNVRHNVSDWFAKVNTKPDVQWMIVINTSRAKDRKTKTAILEKIKSDFSKFHSKLFELPDTSDHQAFTVFVQGIQQTLLAHLNLIVEIWDKSLRTMYEKRKQHNFDVFSYFTSMTQYGRNYWSFGAIEYAISIFDDVEGLLIEVVNRAQELESPTWLSQLLNISIENRPNIVKMFGISSLDRKEAHYLGMRNYILCQQIVLAIHLYQHKMKSNDAAPSLRSDCAIEILRRTLLCIDGVKEFNTQMNNQRDIHKTNCWIYLTVSESIDTCSLLCDISHLDIAPSFLSKLNLARFDAIYNLAKTNTLEKDGLVLWLKENETNEAKSLLSVFQSTDALCQEIEKSFEICIYHLTHANRHRHAVYITYQYFEYLRSINRKCPPPKSISLKVLKSFPKQESTAKMLKSVYEGCYNEEILPISFFISQCDENNHSSFLEICQKSENQINWKSIDTSDLFHVSIDTFDAIQTKDSYFDLEVEIFSKTGFDLSNSKVYLHFSSFSGSNIVQNANLSTLSLQYDNKENTCRLVSEGKMGNSKNENSEKEGEHFTIESESFVLKPSINKVICRTQLTKVGCFVLEKIEITSLEKSNLKFETVHAFSRRPPILYCMSTPHFVAIISDNNQPYLAGVIQKVEIEIEAKCDIEKESTLQFIAPTSMFKFLEATTKSWLDTLQITVQPMKCHQKSRIEIDIWLKIDSTICESAAVQKRTLVVEWMDRRYTLPMSFVPIMVITSKTSMLTTNILLEVEVSRAAGNDVITNITDATLLASDAIENEKSAEIMTRLPVRCELLSVMNFVWKLPLKGSCVKHCLRMEYTAISPFDQPGLPSYSFDDEVELSVPDVRFEICTQVLSQQPGAQLCRASSPCHFVISIRCLVDEPSTLFVVLEADDRIWTLTERTKVCSVKDSGLGQLALSIVPVVAGYLPFPSVSIYECQQQGLSDVHIPGNELLCFNRTAGKQIRVLSANNSDANFGKDDSNRGSNRITKKIVKLFD